MNINDLPTVIDTALAGGNGTWFAVLALFGLTVAATAAVLAMLKASGYKVPVTIPLLPAVLFGVAPLIVGAMLLGENNSEHRAETLEKHLSETYNLDATFNSTFMVDGPELLQEPVLVPSADPATDQPLLYVVALDENNNVTVTVSQQQTVAPVSPVAGN